MATVTQENIYTEVRSYLIGLFSCPSDSVIKGYQNGSPLPQNAVVMSILYEKNLDVSSNYYDTQHDKKAIQQSVELTMQIDCYGADAASRARKLSSSWKNHHAAEQLKCCQPLYSKEVKQVPFVNEQSQYEMRCTVELSIQYNPEFEYEQNYLGMPITQLITQ